MKKLKKIQSIDKQLALTALEELGEETMKEFEI